jgi:anti-sigma B factor antagonist
MSFSEILESYNSLHGGAPVELRERNERRLKLALRGELDMQASNDLTPLLEAAILECPPKGGLLLDLSLVNYISSTGVGLLTMVLVKANQRSVSLILLDMPPKVRNIINTLGFLTFFKEEDNSCD